MDKKRVTFYVDGFNIYYGLKRKIAVRKRLSDRLGPRDFSHFPATKGMIRPLAPWREGAIRERFGEKGSVCGPAQGALLAGRRVFDDRYGPSGSVKGRS